MPMRAALKETIEVSLIMPDNGDFAGKNIAQHPVLDVVWGDGTTVGLIDEWWSNYRTTLATATNDDLDLRALSGGPRLGAVAFAEIRALFLFSDQDLTISGHPTTNAFTGLGTAWTMKVCAGTTFRYVCPTDGKMPVSATDKVLRINNASGATATYSILLLGTSA